MIIHFTDHEAHSRLRFCAPKPKFIPYESAYSIFSRFAQANVLTGTSMVKVVDRTRGPKLLALPKGKWLHRIDSVDYDRVLQAIEISPKDFASLFLFPTFIQLDAHVDRFLNFCPLCLVQGCHYTIFQYEMISVCPIHNHSLQSKCPHCSASMEYRLSSSLFKVPFGCSHCGSLLADPMDNRTLHFRNSESLTRLNKAHAVLLMSKARMLEFSVGAGKNLYYDNALHLSLSEGQFLNQERRLFERLQKIAIGHARNTLDLPYPKYCLRDASTVDGSAIDISICVVELISIIKSIFRNFTKTYLPGIKLTNGTVWRCAEGCSVMPDYYAHLAMLDWYCFWLDTSIFSMRNGLYRGFNKSLSLWVAEQFNHPAFKRLDLAGKKWLLSRIMGAEILVRLSHQFGARSTASRRDFYGQIYLKYERAISPVCWAALFVQNKMGATDISFISVANDHSRIAETDNKAFVPTGKSSSNELPYLL